VNGLSSKREVDLLRDRAFKMLKHAKKSFSDGDYDIAAFLAEQAVQLFLKSVILERTGEVPRTHVIRQLLHIFENIFENCADRVDVFVRENRSLLIRLEEAYLASRYLFKEYEMEEVGELIDFAEKVINFVKDIQSAN